MSEEASQQQPPATEMVPKARLDEALAKNARLEKAVTTWQGKYEEAKTELFTVKETAAAEVAAVRETYETEKVFGAAGIDDPDVIDLIRRKYSAAEAPTNEDGTPAEKPALAAWFATYAETKPAILRPFLKDTPAPASAAVEPPKPGAGVKAPAAAPPRVAAQAPPSAPAAVDLQGLMRLPMEERKAALEAMRLAAPKV